jgi:hypothetical protein
MREAVDIFHHDGELKAFAISFSVASHDFVIAPHCVASHDFIPAQRSTHPRKPEMNGLCFKRHCCGTHSLKLCTALSTPYRDPFKNCRVGVEL